MNTLTNSFISAHIEESKLWDGIITSQNDKYIFINHKIKIVKKNMVLKNAYNNNSFSYSYKKANGDLIELIIEL